MRYEEQALRPAIQVAFEQGGLDAIGRLVVGLLNEQEMRHEREMEAMEQRHQAVVAKLEARIAELEKRLGKNSSNSSKPPSSDGLKRTRSLRNNPSGRKPGGQPGHPGQRLRPSADPDVVIDMPLEQCPQCQSDLSEQPVESEEVRQVFELPPIKLRVTEYRAARKRCPQCGRLFGAEFPESAQAPTQYGPNMQAVMSYLQAWQLLPHERSAQVCEDLFGHRPSAGSIVRSMVKSAAQMEPAVAQIATALSQAPVLYADETGVRCAGKTHWLHVASTAELTLYSHSTKRGMEGLSTAGVLPQYGGKLMHDFWGPYDKLEHCEHLRCNAHLLRELKACAEDGHRWAQELASTLVAMKQARDEALQSQSPCVTERRRKELEARYDQWIGEGLQAHPAVEKTRVKQGRAKQSAEHNLLKRLSDKKSEVLAFLREIALPFDNNQAERDLRMMKVQQKVSGCFRSEAGAKGFCVIRSYLATARKQGMNIIESIRNAVIGNPQCMAMGAE
jgi:transposase